jgi:large subunit ribosomal protein L6
MSKVGKKPIIVPDNVEIKIENDFVLVKGPKGELKVPILKGVKVEREENLIKLSIDSKDKQIKSNWGTMRALLQNAVNGVLNPFEKKLILEGVGYRINKVGNDLELSLGFSHPVSYKAREGITFEVEKNNVLRVIGIDKALVGQVAAEIRALKKPEPYKGKGFRYADEVIRRKAGKKAAGSS